MEKRIKTVVCLLLLLSVVLSMSSCGILGIGKQNDGKRYTGGFSIESHFYIHREIHWLETFDEAMTAIEHLRAAGNDLPNIYIAGYENETVDAKYLILVNDYRTPKQKEGEEWYDRKFNKVEKIEYYGFLDKVSIEELEYSYVKNYKRITFSSYRPNDEHEQLQNISWECMIKNDSAGNPHEICEVVDVISGTHFGGIEYPGVENHKEDLPENFHEDFIKSLVYIGD